MECKYKQNCGDTLIVLEKSDKKVRNRYFYKGYFEGYSRIIEFRLDRAQKGNIRNPDKRDKYGFLCDEKKPDSYIYFVWKNMERRCYYIDCPGYSNYGAKGVHVSEEFKLYSNFKNWYIKHSNGDFSLEIDKDCLCTINGISKIYSPDTCILIPSSINTFISTLGKGIYPTKAGTYCVRLRRVYKRINKNFKTLADAISYKKLKDIEYLELLLDKHNLEDNIKECLRQYVKIYEYPSNI